MWKRLNKAGVSDMVAVLLVVLVLIVIFFVWIR